MADDNKRIIQKFKSSRCDDVYEVVETEKGLSCNCKGWIYRRYCKHLEYVLNNATIKDGKIVSVFSEITDIPTRAEAELMDYGKNQKESEKWHLQHLKVIKLKGGDRREKINVSVGSGETVEIVKTGGEKDE